MKIETGFINTGSTTRGQSTARQASPVSSSSSSSAIVSISSRQEKFEQGEEVNMEKVETIRRAISEGRFEINPEKIAKSIIDDLKLQAGHKG